MAALLHHVSVHPHAVVLETLGLISSKVLQPAQGLPPYVQAEAFSDAALLQASPCLMNLSTLTPLSTPLCFRVFILTSSSLAPLGTELDRRANLVLLF